MLEWLIEVVKGRKDDIFGTFLDIEIAHGPLNMKKLFQVMICYG